MQKDVYYTNTQNIYISLITHMNKVHHFTFKNNPHNICTNSWIAYLLPRIWLVPNKCPQPWSNVVIKGHGALQKDTGKSCQRGISCKQGYPPGELEVRRLEPFPGNPILHTLVPTPLYTYTIIIHKENRSPAQHYRAWGQKNIIVLVIKIYNLIALIQFPFLHNTLT